MSSTFAGSETVTIEIPADIMERSVDAVQTYYRKETGRTYPEWAVMKAIRNVFEERMESFSDDMGELLTSPSTDESFLFRRYLEEALESVQVFEAEEVSDDIVNESEPSTVFNGFRPFSAKRLAAMASYIARNGAEIYKTKLNKLLFYADFTNYYLHGRSISGSHYVHLPFGPVPENHESHLQSAAETGAVHLETAGTDAVVIKPGTTGVDETLTEEERSTIDWVLATYGKLSTNAISDLSHQEKAYKFTKQGEQIAYAYAKFFERLP
jgi:uncharacterized phage-associated protein